MVAKTETMPIQENLSTVKKNLRIVANFKANTVWHLTHLNCHLDHRMKNTEIAETNGALFRTLRNICFDSHTVSPLLKHKHRLSISDFFGNDSFSLKDAQNVRLFLSSTSIEKENYRHFEGLVKAFRWAITFLHFINKQQVCCHLRPEKDRKASIRILNYLTKYS